jgi:hypothetical protein
MSARMVSPLLSGLFAHCQKHRSHPFCRPTLPTVLHALASNVEGARTAMIPGTTHPMFEQAPRKYCEIVLAYLAED